MREFSGGRSSSTDGSSLLSSNSLTGLETCYTHPPTHHKCIKYMLEYKMNWSAILSCLFDIQLAICIFECVLLDIFVGHLRQMHRK